MSATRIAKDEKRELDSAIRDAKIDVIGQDLVKNRAQAKVLSAVVKAYGDSPAGFIYAEPTRARTTLRPPDVLLCHPDVGLMVFEVKGHVIDDLHGIEAGSILVRYKGRQRPVNAVREAEDQMYDIKRDVMVNLSDRRNHPLFNCMVAFPNIDQSEWKARSYDQAHPEAPLLFADHIQDIGKLKTKVGQLVNDTLERASISSPLDIDSLTEILKVFGNSDVINESRPPRPGVERDKLGGYVDEMMALEKYLSEEQKQLSRMQFEGTQRLIRGVAGSGKSVVLANLVARHLRGKLEPAQGSFLPEEEVSIAVTCFNRSLVDFLGQKIRTAYKARTLNDDIPSNVLLVSHLNGLIWQLKRERGWPLDYININGDQTPSERAAAYRKQIAKFKKENPSWYQTICFDTIFIDEGQDFEPEEYRLLLDLIKPHAGTGERPIVIFYDDAQNLYGRTRPVWKDLGISVAGERTTVMRECFRNPRQVVELAFNVLLGSRAPDDLRVQTRTYADVAYLKERDLLEEKDDFYRVGFAEREDARSIVKSFDTQAQELEWVRTEIVRLIAQEEVRPEDILVMFYRNGFDHQELKRRVSVDLPKVGFIEPFGKNDQDKDRYIFEPHNLTISTVNGAKGYDAPIVFLVGTDRFDTGKEGRAAFYVGATRSKLRLYITGAGKGPTLLQEALKVNQEI